MKSSVPACAPLQWSESESNTSHFPLTRAFPSTLELLGPRKPQLLAACLTHSDSQCALFLLLLISSRFVHWISAAPFMRGEEELWLVSTCAAS